MAVTYASSTPLPSVEERSVQRFGRTAREVRLAREFVVDGLRLRGAPGDVVDAFRLAVSELGANAVEHGDDGWTVAVAVAPSLWSLSVIGGTVGPTNPVLHPEVWAMVEPAVGHGRGLAIVRNLMDGVTVDVVGRRIRVRCWLQRRS